MGSVGQELLLPDRELLLDPIHQIGCAFESLTAVRGGDGDVERHSPDPELTDSVLRRDGVDAVAPGEFCDDLSHHIPRRRVPHIFDARDGLAVVVVAHHALERHDGARPIVEHLRVEGVGVDVGVDDT